MRHKNHGQASNPHAGHKMSNDHGSHDRHAGHSVAMFRYTFLWGIGMGAQDSCLKAVLSAVVSPERRSTAFGIFDDGFGVAWFVGSAIAAHGEGHKW